MDEFVAHRCDWSSDVLARLIDQPGAVIVKDPKLMRLVAAASADDPSAPWPVLQFMQGFLNGAF